MSLTTFIKNKDVKSIFKEEFKIPIKSYKHKIIAAPMTKNYSMIGTAFDYLMRFYLEYHNPKVTTNIWVGEIGYSRLQSNILIEDDERFILSGGIDVNPTIHLQARNNFRFAKNSYSEYLKSGNINNDILTSVIYLAQLDLIQRIGQRGINYITSNVDDKDIMDLKNLITLVNSDTFKVNNYCSLNPTFGIGGTLVRGADADLIIDNQLIDIKTTKSMMNRNIFDQLIGYYTLNIINNGKNLDWIGVYFSRFGIKIMYNINDIINPKTYPLFVERFKDKAIDIFWDGSKNNYLKRIK